MNEYWIYIDGQREFKVEAEDEQSAIGVWMDDQGYETLSEVAREYFCEPEDIKARMVERF